MVPAGPPNYNMVQITGTPKQLRYTYPNNGVVPFNSLPSQINGLLKQALPFSGAVDLSVLDAISASFQATKFYGSNRPNETIKRCWFETHN